MPDECGGWRGRDLCYRRGGEDGVGRGREKFNCVRLMRVEVNTEK